MAIQYGTTTKTLQPELQVQNGIPTLFYAHVTFPAPEIGAKLFNIDTGSVGFVIPKSLLLQPGTTSYYPWVEPTGQTMTMIYKPSGVSPTGEIVTITGLTLQGVDGTIPVGPVKALAHDETTHTFMMGVGFGLQAISHYGPVDQPQPWTSAAGALDNPFLNLVGMSRDPGAPFQAAYAMSAATFGGVNGKVVFGQTEELLEGFRFLPITPDPASPAGFQLPWVDLTVTLPGQAPVETSAQLLMDAGIENMFLGVFQPSPPPPGGSANQLKVADWTNAEVRIRAADAAGFPVIDYLFVNRDPQKVQFHLTDANQPASPNEILNGGPSPQGGSYINTGVHLLALYDYVLDAANNRLGFRVR